MTNNPPPGVVMHRGLTLVELALAITIIILLVSLAFIGCRSWKRGSDRACCILAIRNVQLATRAYQNLYGYGEGMQPEVESGTRDIAQHLAARGYIEPFMFEKIHAEGRCPSGGEYHCDAPDFFPERGELYIGCSLAESANHVPASFSDW